MPRLLYVLLLELQPTHTRLHSPSRYKVGERLADPDSVHWLPNPTHPLNLALRHGGAFLANAYFVPRSNEAYKVSASS